MNPLINQDKRLVIISPGYNCSKFIDMWYNSLAVQNYKNWICIAIDDMSTDDTYSRLINIAGFDNRIYVYRNLVKKYQVRNWYEVIHNDVDNVIKYNSSNLDVEINDDDIIIFHDLDDFFGTKYAFELTIKEYQYRDIYCLTARNFQLSDYYNHDAKIYINRDDLLLADKHEYSLYSYVAKLFKNIPAEHFIDPDTGEFYEVCGDYAITMPILWQAGPEHHHHLFVDNFIIYNNIRLECDDNKVHSPGLTAHEVAWPKLTKSFRSLVRSNLIPIYD